MANLALEEKKRELEQLLAQLHIASSFDSVDLTERIYRLAADIRSQEQPEREGQRTDERAGIA